jgi:hypothetical protein
MKKMLLTAAMLASFSAVSFAKDVEIPVAELPKAVTESITKNHPNATLVSAEKDLKMDDSIQHFEVKVRDGDKMKELTVLPDGTISKTENDD